MLEETAKAIAVVQGFIAACLIFSRAFQIDDIRFVVDELVEFL
jgi:hypothetical protein